MRAAATVDHPVERSPKPKTPKRGVTPLPYWEREVAQDRYAYKKKKRKKRKSLVKKVFSASIDIVVHLDRLFDPSDSRIRRETMEIRAVVPSLHDDFSTEPLFVRDQIGSPLRWTGALPPEGLIRRLESSSQGMRVVSVLKAGALE